MKTYFLHSSAGDIIYALPAIEKHSGKARIINAMTPKLHASMKPLIDSQGHELCHLSDTEVPAGAISLEQFSRLNRFHNGHLVKTFGQVLDVEVDLYRPWLKVEPDYSYAEYAVINVTDRYRDKLFNWGKEVTWLLPRTKGVVFIGTRQEFEDFVRKYFTIKFTFLVFHECQDHLEAARIIAGAKYFSGTQSSCLAIAEGLGRHYRYERSPNSDNTMTGRGNEVILNPISRQVHYFFARAKELINGI